MLGKITDPQSKQILSYERRNDYFIYLLFYKDFNWTCLIVKNATSVWVLNYIGNESSRVHFLYSLGTKPKIYLYFKHIYMLS